MFLISPQAGHIKSYIEFCVGYKKNNQADFFLNSLTLNELGHIPSEHAARLVLDELAENACDSASGRVPASQYWLIDRDEVVGVGNVRHWLTPALQFFGGHIGYGVRSDRFGSGIGTVLLGELLRTLPGFGIRTALLTCDITNTASRRVMEKNGGRLLDTVEVNSGGRKAHRFLIDRGPGPLSGLPVQNHAMLYQAEAGEVFLMPAKAVDEGGRIVSYYYDILREGAHKVGWIVYRVADDQALYYDGNIGYYIKKEHRGSGYAESACKAMGAKLRRLGVTRTYITCDDDNGASNAICRKLGAVLLELAQQRSSAGRKIKCRYLWRLSM